MSLASSLQMNCVGSGCKTMQNRCCTLGHRRCSIESMHVLTNVSIASLDGALDGLGDLSRSRLPCTETDDWDFGPGVELEGLLTGCGRRILRHGGSIGV